MASMVVGYLIVKMWDSTDTKTKASRVRNQADTGRRVPHVKWTQQQANESLKNKTRKRRTRSQRTHKILHNSPDQLSPLSNTISLIGLLVDTEQARHRGFSQKEVSEKRGCVPGEGEERAVVLHHPL